MGFPLPILIAYTNFQENVTYRNNLAGSIGRPHRRACGIPQGCPLSMLFVAVIMRPWVGMMTTLGLTPRVLADDILLIAEGPEGYAKFQSHFDTTHDYIHTMGATLAPSKSYAFATHNTTRAWLKSHIWTHLNQTIKVVLHTRDLGNHINTTNSNRNTTGLPDSPKPQLRSTSSNTYPLTTPPKPQAYEQKYLLLAFMGVKPHTLARLVLPPSRQPSPTP